MRAILKWSPWFIMLLIVGGMAMGFYFGNYKIAFGLMGLFVLVIMLWGAMLQTKNIVNNHLDIHRLNTVPDDVDRYSR